MEFQGMLSDESPPQCSSRLIVKTKAEGQKEWRYLGDGIGYRGAKQDPGEVVRGRLQVCL